ncbi:ATP-binding protein [Sorangium sp. So ce854]|uniref:ATP-binding protein n=1 Tax=Sorangium sp. So ce854 TaxID=3133322 RepID=UPI003F632AD4
MHDTGRGIAPDLLAWRGTPFLTDRGAGLGVVLARSAIQQHGGALTYASQVGRGTTARIRLPSSPLGACGARGTAIPGTRDRYCS